MKKYIIILSAILAVSCSRNEEKPQGGSFAVEVSAVQQDITRTSMNDGVLGWSVSDALGIYADRIQMNRQFVVNSACDKFYGTFLYTGSGYTTATYRAYYPYCQSSDGAIISASLPVIQNGKWDGKADFMISEPIVTTYSENANNFPQLDFQFKAAGHLFGVLKLTLQDDADGALSNEKVSFVQINTNGVDITGDFKANVEDYTAGAQFSQCSDSVRLVFSGNDAPSLDSPVVVYAVVKPTDTPITDMKVTITTTGGTAVFTSAGPVTVNRGTVKELPAITVSDKWERLPSLNDKFTDSAFLSYLLSYYDANNDGFLVSSEAENITSVVCPSSGIESFDGIELLKNITVLDISGNTVNSLDLSGHTALRTLNCSGTSLETLELSGCTSLESLNISGTNMTALDLGSCKAISSFTADGCSLLCLDMSGNEAVQFVTLKNSATESILLSGCLSLQNIDCTANRLKSLDLSGCSSLTVVSCYDNSPLSDINLSDCSSLESLWCRQCALTYLDIGSCTKLSTIYCQRNSLKSLDTSNNPNLSFLYCHTNDFTSLDVSKNLNLTTLNCQTCPYLTTIYLASGQNIPSFTYDSGSVTIKYR